MRGLLALGERDLDLYLLLESSLRRSFLYLESELDLDRLERDELADRLLRLGSFLLSLLLAGERLAEDDLVRSFFYFGSFSFFLLLPLSSDELLEADEDELELLLELASLPFFALDCFASCTFLCSSINLLSSF